MTFKYLTNPRILAIAAILFSFEAHAAYYTLEYDHDPSLEQTDPNQKGLEEKTPLDKDAPTLEEQKEGKPIPRSAIPEQRPVSPYLQSKPLERQRIEPNKLDKKNITPLHLKKDRLDKKQIDMHYLEHSSLDKTRIEKNQLKNNKLEKNELPKNRIPRSPLPR